jgi:hypothetical protein
VYVPIDTIFLFVVGLFFLVLALACIGEFLAWVGVFLWVIFDCVASCYRWIAFEEEKEGEKRLWWVDDEEGG